MNILCLSKRQYTGKDLLNDKYGRLFELPKELALKGNRVTGVCLSYRIKNDGHIYYSKNDPSLVDWYSFNLINGFFSYLKLLKKIMIEQKPDFIFASSDIPHIIIASYFSNKYKTPLIVDLYDNYESFGLSQIPGMKNLFYKAIKKAELVICVSSNLLQYIKENHKIEGKLYVIENGIPISLFKPGNKKDARKSLSLPPDAKTIGTVGALHSSRGIQILFDAFKLMVVSDQNLHLVLAGPIGKDIKLPTGANVHYLGNLPYNEVPTVINAIDVAVVCNLKTEFGKYCFPQKAYEILACKTPFVATDVGVITSLLVKYPELLFRENNVKNLVAKLNYQLSNPTYPEITARTWKEQAERLSNNLITIRASKMNNHN